MADPVGQFDHGPEGAGKGTAVASPSSLAAWPSAGYLRRLERIRRGVGIAVAVCGAGIVAFAYLDRASVQGAAAWELGMLACGTGMLACLASAALLTVESLVRTAIQLARFARATRVRFTLRRMMLLIATVSVCLAVLLQITQGWATLVGLVALAVLAVLWELDRELTSRKAERAQQEPTDR